MTIVRLFDTIFLLYTHQFKDVQCSQGARNLSRSDDGDVLACGMWITLQRGKACTTATQPLHRARCKSSDSAPPVFHGSPPCQNRLQQTHCGHIGDIAHPQIICYIVVLKVLKVVLKVLKVLDIKDSSHTFNFHLQ